MIPGIGNATANKIYSAIAFPTSGRDEPRLLNAAMQETADPPAASDGPDLVRTLQTTQIPSSIRNKSLWQNFVQLISELTRDDTRSNPAKQIETVLSSGFDQYLLEKYENADSRMKATRCATNDLSVLEAAP